MKSFGWIYSDLNSLRLPFLSQSVSVSLKNEKNHNNKRGLQNNKRDLQRKITLALLQHDPARVRRTHDGNVFLGAVAVGKAKHLRRHTGERWTYK